eukprot:GEMP01027002.1.p1 GENE.GEMP01027002.1~~GEMP01027002.1.p1  ORF type:complete len:423 (+),score=74.07 GEMP01027002.1:428-1696(+)
MIYLVFIYFATPKTKTICWSINLENEVGHVHFLLIKNYRHSQGAIGHLSMASHDSRPSVLMRLRVGDMLSADKKLSSSSPRISIPRCALSNKSPPRASAASRASYFISRETEKMVLQHLANKSAGRSWAYHSLIPQSCQAKSDAYSAPSESASARDPAKSNSPPVASKKSSPRSPGRGTEQLSPPLFSYRDTRQDAHVRDSKNSDAHIGNEKHSRSYKGAVRESAMATTTPRQDSGVPGVSSTTRQEEGTDGPESPSSGRSARRKAGKSAHVSMWGMSKGSHGPGWSSQEEEGDGEPNCLRCMFLQKQVYQLQERNELNWMHYMNEPNLLLELEALREKVKILEGTTNSAFVGVCTKCSYLREITVRQQREIEAINLENTKLVQENRAVNNSLVREMDTRFEENAAHQAAMREALQTLQSFG